MYLLLLAERLTVLTVNSLATEIVEAILSDLNRRSGIGDALNDIDSKIYDELNQDLIKIVKKVLKDNR